MKKFLSFLLAVLMIVSVMVPMLTLLVSAEGNAGETPAIDSDFPELIITEYHANAVYFSNVYNSLMNGGAANEETRFLASTLYTKYCGEVLYAPTYVAAGASVSGLYVKNEREQWMTGTIIFEPASGNAVEGVQYYRSYNFTGNDNEIVEFIEVYNSSSRPINLYEYHIVRDPDAFKHGDVPQYIDIYGGTLASAAHGQYMKKAGNITEFDPDILYYTKSSVNTYVPVNPAQEGAPKAGKTYYYEVPEGAFVENPSEEEGAWLQPGQVAVLWNFTYRDWQYNLTEEVFKAYFSAAYGFGQNWDDILFLGLDGNSSDTDRYVAKKQPIPYGEMSEGGCVRLGLIHDSFATSKPDDTVREELWTSWVLHAHYMGINYNASFALQDTVIGSTTVVGGNYLVYDQKRDEYVPVSKEAGTADKNGKAVAGIQYYKPSASAFTNGTNSRSVSYMYGLDASADIKEGRAYTYNSSGISPGVLDNIQEAAFPNYSKNVEELSYTPKLVISEVVPDNGATDAYEYVEVVNVSGAPLNVFDYSFLGHPDNITHYNDQFFNKVMPIIPGEYGSILASSGITKYQEGYVELAPTNVTYQNGWLQPGEAALLWPFNPDSFNQRATFEQFRSHHKIDDSVKVFAMDGDGTNGTGRPQRQDLQDIGLSMYGLISNDKLMWADNKYTSDPILQPITYSSGLTKQNVRGIAVRDCDFFVLCAALHVTFANVTVGIDYGYQYVWGQMQGTTNKLGSYLRMSYATSCGGQDFSGTGSVVTEAWKASPGKLIAEQKGLLATSNRDRYIVYMQDFDGYGTVEAFSTVAQKLGITTTLTENWEETENGGAHLLEISEGKLKVNNATASDVKLTLMSDDALTLQGLVVKYKIGEEIYSSDSDSNLNIGIEGADLVLTISAGTTLEYDYITVYTDDDAIRSANEELYGNGFMITEFHNENADFKAMEITNVSDIAMNLYDAMIVTTSQQTANGVLQTWNHAIKLAAGVPVSSYDPLYKSLKHISNPTTCMVQPGESVVVWLISDAESSSSVGINDFRNYYKDLGNEKLAELDTKGNAVVKVIATYDQSASDNYLRYGLAKKNNTYYTLSDRSFFPHVFSSIVPESDTEYSLGYVSQDKYGLVATLNFVHMGEIVEKDNEGNVTGVINAYAHRSVLNGLTKTGVENTSASVNTSNNGASISFRASVDAAYYNRMVELFGADNTKHGILIARADTAMKVDAMRPYLLDAADILFIDDEGTRSTTTSTRKTLYGNAHAVDAGYYSVTYSAVAYLAVETQAFGTITKYAENAYHQSAKQIAATAMMQYLTAAEAAEYRSQGIPCYEISSGKYSIYTREQIERLNVLCK